MNVGPLDYKYIGFRPDFEDEVLDLFKEKRIEESLPPSSRIPHSRTMPAGL